MQNKRAFLTLEYSILILVITAALVAMAAYLRTNIQERYRQGGNVFGEGEQYEPGKTIIGP